jgi:hypothetical protein
MFRSKIWRSGRSPWSAARSLRAWTGFRPRVYAEDERQGAPYHGRRVPGVYPAHAFVAILAIVALHEMNNLRVSRGPLSSTPTPGTIYL